MQSTFVILQPNLLQTLVKGKKHCLPIESLSQKVPVTQGVFYFTFCAKYSHI